MSKLIAILFLLFASTGISILTLMYGWGMQPRSWWWILGMGIGGQIVIQGILEAVKREDREQ